MNPEMICVDLNGNPFTDQELQVGLDNFKRAYGLNNMSVNFQEYMISCHPRDEAVQGFLPLMNDYTALLIRYNNALRNKEFATDSEKTQEFETIEELLKLNGALWKQSIAKHLSFDQAVHFQTLLKEHTSRVTHYLTTIVKDGSTNMDNEVSLVEIAEKMNDFWKRAGTTDFSMQFEEYMECFKNLSRDPTRTDLVLTLNDKSNEIGNILQKMERAPIEVSSEIECAMTECSDDIPVIESKMALQEEIPVIECDSHTKKKKTKKVNSFLDDLISTSDTLPFGWREDSALETAAIRLCSALDSDTWKKWREATDESSVRQQVLYLNMAVDERKYEETIQHLPTHFRHLSENAAKKATAASVLLQHVMNTHKFSPQIRAKWGRKMEEAEKRIASNSYTILGGIVESMGNTAKHWNDQIRKDLNCVNLEQQCLSSHVTIGTQAVLQKWFASLFSGESYETRITSILQLNKEVILRAARLAQQKSSIVNEDARAYFRIGIKSFQDVFGEELDISNEKITNMPHAAHTDPSIIKRFLSHFLSTERKFSNDIIQFSQIAEKEGRPALGTSINKAANEIFTRQLKLDGAHLNTDEGKRLFTILVRMHSDMMVTIATDQRSAPLKIGTQSVSEYAKDIATSIITNETFRNVLYAVY